MKLPLSIPFRLRHFFKKCYDSNYRHYHQEWQRIRKIPRYQHGETEIEGARFEFVDSISFLAMRESIFQNEIYQFKSKSESPLILDGGANVGLSIRYFKKIYPKSRIIGFEPDPKIFKVLERNCRELEGVELHACALWKENGFLNFNSEGSDAGTLMDTDRAKTKIQVPTIRLRDYLQESVDFLKLDIEGAEGEVLSDCAERLNQVSNLFVEYHGFVDRDPDLSKLLGTLESASFRYHIDSDLISPKPFMQRHVRAGMDSTLNISAYRKTE